MIETVVQSRSGSNTTKSLAKEKRKAKVKEKVCTRDRCHFLFVSLPWNGYTVAEVCLATIIAHLTPLVKRFKHKNIPPKNISPKIFQYLLTKIVGYAILTEVIRD